MANYKDAGVDVEAGYKAVELMKKHIQKTMRSEVLTGIGGFGGLFSLEEFPCGNQFWFREPMGLEQSLAGVPFRQA